MAESNAVRLARLEEKFGAMADDISEIKKILVGNGKPGLIKDIENMENDFNDKINIINTKMSESEGGKKMLTGIFGSGLFCGIVVYIVSKIFN
jgi:hypothetical protein